MLAARFLAFLIFAGVPLIAVGQQDVCLDKGRVDVLRSKILNGTGAKEANVTFHKELIESATSLNELLQKSWLPGKDGEKAKVRFGEAQIAAGKKLCSMLNIGPWPSRVAVGEDGMNSFLYLLGRTLTIKMQIEMYPLVAASFEKGELTGSDTLAAYVDRLRVALGRKQLYGTQVSLRDGFLVQAPIETASEVDERRATMKLDPLRQYERSLETANQRPLIRAVSEPVGSFAGRRLSSGTPGGGEDALGLEGEEGPVIRLETAFVSIDVNIRDAVDGASMALEKSDFKLYDNGRPVQIDTFSKAETPFDIVLLLDLSGSTSDKVGLIKKTTRRFVEMKRAGDRVAVVTFNDTQTIVSELESDQAVLLERIKKIGGNGASAIWESLRFSMEMLDKSPDKSRRRAVVLMSDGADNLLSFYPRFTKQISYADLIETVQNSNTTIFPVFLDTFEGPSGFRDNAQRTLDYIAEQSGGTMYTAKKLDDVADIYDRVLKGVGTVYSLGFSPEAESAGREWRTIKVEVPSRPTLRLRHRPGYFTR